MVKKLNKELIITQISEKLTPENVTFKDIEMLRLGGKRYLASELLKEHAQYLQEARIKDSMNFKFKP